jgi:hypothetical protein
LTSRMQGGGGAGDEPEPLIPPQTQPPRPAPPPGAPSRPANDEPPKPKPPSRPPADSIDRPSTFTQHKVKAAAAAAAGTDLSVTSIESSPLPGARNDPQMEANPALITPGGSAPRSIVDTFAAPGGKPPPPAGASSRPKQPVKTPRRLRGKGLRRASSSSTPPGTAGRVKIVGMDLETKDAMATGEIQSRISPAPWARKFADKINTADDFDDAADIRPNTAESLPDTGTPDSLDVLNPNDEELARQVLGKNLWPGKTDMAKHKKVAKQAAMHEGKESKSRKGYAKKIKKAYTTDSGEPLPDWCPKFAQNFFKSLAKYHLLVSILAAGPHGMFTRPQRATVATSVLLLEMAGAAVATRYLECEEGQAMIYGIGSAVLCAPLGFALAKLFVVTGQKYRESGAFLRDFAVQKKRQLDGDPAARAKLAQMVAHDNDLAETSGRAKCGRCMRNHAGQLMSCYDWTAKTIKAQFQAKHEDEDIRTRTGSGSTRSDTPTFNVGHNDEVEMIKRKNAEMKGLSSDVAGLRGDALPPEATYRYYLWRWLHHAIYCCCFLVAVTASFNIIFYGMKFDETHIQCWSTGFAFSIATDYVILQPLVALFRLHGDRRVARQQAAKMAAKRAALGSTIAFQTHAARGPAKTEWTAEEFGA